MDLMLDGGLFADLQWHLAKETGRLLESSTCRTGRGECKMPQPDDGTP